MSKDTAGSRFLALPETSVGKWTARLLLLSVVFALLNTLVVLPVTEQRAGLEFVQSVVNAAVGLCVVGTGICGLVALLTYRERSWAVVLSVALFAVMIVLMVSDFIVPG